MIYQYRKSLQTKRLLQLEVNVWFIIIFIIITVLVGYYLQALTKSGAIGAILIGFFVATGFGLAGLLVLGAFFVSSSLLSKYKAIEKQSTSELHEKSGARDFQQVFANGGVAAVAGLLYFYWKSPLFLIIFLIAIASSTADTWASEVGVLSKTKPISVKDWKQVARGTSGAVSILGTAMALLGAFFIGLTASALFKINAIMCLLVVLCGFFGNLIDTLLGAYSQVTFRCERCGLVTEKRVHCQEPTHQLAGKVFINNDAVNFLSGLLAALAGAFIYFFIG